MLSTTFIIDDLCDHVTHPTVKLSVSPPRIAQRHGAPRQPDVSAPRIAQRHGAPRQPDAAQRPTEPDAAPRQPDAAGGTARAVKLSVSPPRIAQRHAAQRPAEAGGTARASPRQPDTA